MSSLSRVSLSKHVAMPRVLQTYWQNKPETDRPLRHNLGVAVDASRDFDEVAPVEKDSPVPVETSTFRNPVRFAKEDELVVCARWVRLDFRAGELQPEDHIVGVSDQVDAQFASFPRGRSFSKANDLGHQLKHPREVEQLGLVKSLWVVHPENS